jgi:5-methylcytosine-specific restriction protein A
MARTHGHGNPDWTRDETILALDLYFSIGTTPDRNDSRVEKLSELLQNLPYHASHERQGSFRNTASVFFKLQNLRQVATGEGLSNVSAMDRRVWAEFGESPDKVNKLAELIRNSVASLNEAVLSRDDINDEEFFEGRILTVLHRRRERDPRVRARLLSKRRKLAGLSCDLCNCTPMTGEASLEDACFEAHHTVPIAATAERITRISDMALLCANCHRVLHRAIAVQKRWLTVDECRAFMVM